MGNQAGDRAVVLGGGMAGLLTARVLAEAYTEVTIVDRDELLGSAGPRCGVPQGPHTNALLARGQQVLEKLFPGLTAELAAAGLPVLDMGEMHWYLEGARLRNAHTGLVAISLTQPKLEAHVRARVAAIPNVTFAQNCDIAGLATTPGRDRVTGARVRSGASGAERILDADLVVDASGQGSRMPTWLSELGYQRPAQERMKIGLAYTTTEFVLPSSPLECNLPVISLATPRTPLGAFFWRVGGDRHQLSLTSMLTGPPSAGIEGVLACARSLPVPQIYEAIKDVAPDAGPVTIRFPASVRRRYERLTSFPDQLILIGDSVCSFNPVYGQGMTVAALEALILRQHLRSGGPPQARRFFRDIARVIDTPWGIAAGGDLSWPEVAGRRSLLTRVKNAYLAKVMSGALFDSHITDQFMRVTGLIDPPRALMRPGLVYRVLRQARRRPAGHARSAGPAGPAGPAVPRRAGQGGCRAISVTAGISAAGRS